MPQNNKPRKPKSYPCVIFSVPENHQAFQMGWRYHVHDVDDDIMYFHDMDRMLEVLQLHGMKAVKEPKMEEIRQRRANRPA